MAVAVALPLALGGCLGRQANVNASGLTNDQQGYYAFFIGQRFTKDQATLAAINPIARQLLFDDLKCRSYGAKSGSDVYITCRAQLEAAQTKPPVVVQAPAATHCTSIPLGGGMVSTNCN